ncbi:MAG TPA: putative glycolipid-binding domain-containing protein [Woeseiaceae bacterium]|nr:putative glycolipid-binding domain-containing protein [Woeseiaceae bacterium]
MVVDSVLWRRLDVSGHDVCRLERSSDGWQVLGMAVFRENGVLAGVTYEVACDPAWRTRRGRVRGWHGMRSLNLDIARTAADTWTLNGAAVPGLEACLDLDLGFTPATNVLPLRRLELGEGEAADAPAAWLDVAAGTLERLPQRYERRSSNTYWYESPTAGYAALLEAFPSGLVRRYPGLWEAEA